MNAAVRKKEAIPREGDLRKMVRKRKWKRKPPIPLLTKEKESFEFAVGRHGIEK